MISWLQSPSSVMLEPPKIKSLTFFPHLFAMKFTLPVACLILSKVIKEPLKRKTESVWKGDDNEVLLNTTLRVQLTLR